MDAQASLMDQCNRTARMAALGEAILIDGRIDDRDGPAVLSLIRHARSEHVANVATESRLYWCQRSLGTIERLVEQLRQKTQKTASCEAVSHTHVTQ